MVDEVTTLPNEIDLIKDDGTYFSGGQWYKRIDEYTSGVEARKSGLKHFMISRKGVIGFKEIEAPPEVEQNND